ncbi:MAG TPA: DUF4381 domain-containing protein [Woeseiaceae bacterium]|nr:DUF4381 domain-containing protein [Woeseiaceae bacterium]
MNPETLPLRDLHLPEAIGWWPPAPGWWLLLGLLLLGAALAVRALYRSHRRNAARRLALAELARLKQAWDADGNTAALAAAISDLLRRAMLAYAPRHEVAGLTGRAWLEWLDRGLERAPFSRGPGHKLEDLPYRDPAASAGEVDVDGLLKAVRRRLQTPLPEQA